MRSTCSGGRGAPPLAMSTSDDRSYFAASPDSIGLSWFLPVSFITQELKMNKDQVKGTAKDVAGKVQQKVGEATGSVSQQVKGVAA